MAAEKVGAKMLAIVINGTKSGGSFDASGWASINGGAEYPISYSAKLPAQKVDTVVAGASVVFTVGWDEAAVAPSGPYGVVPANVTDYYTFTSIFGGYKVGLNAAFVTALDANAAYMDWTPGSPLPNPGSMYNGTAVISMANMFNGRASITTLDLSSFDTSNVATMGSMFRGCTSLTSLGLSSFNTSNVVNMTSMFTDCTSLNSLDLSSFDISNLTLMNSMFVRCSSVTTAYAKTQADADKLNATSDKPANITFVVKP